MIGKVKESLSFKVADKWTHNLVIGGTRDAENMLMNLFG